MRVLQIDTSLEVAAVLLSEDYRLVAVEQHADPRDHAGWLPLAIQHALGGAGWTMASIDVIAVHVGPGSYTGIRVGLAMAKGLAFALGKRVVAVHSLKAIAAGMRNQCRSMEVEAPDYFAPMVDARRMEVYTALYDATLVEHMPAEAMVLTESSFQSVLLQHRICFGGSGAPKWRTIQPHTTSAFSANMVDADAWVEVAWLEIAAERFFDAGSIEAFYLKPVHIQEKKPV
jgi:tRNA threonylcarbamoyladenosine biosynthesis protein TsaB